MALGGVTLVGGYFGQRIFDLLENNAMDQNRLVQLLGYLNFTLKVLKEFYIAFLWLMCICLIHFCISEKLVDNKFVWVNISPYKKHRFTHFLVKWKNVMQACQAVYVLS